MPESLPIVPIGWVRSPRNEIRYDEWGSVFSEIQLDPERFGPDSLLGLDGFSHVELIFVFDRIPVEDVVVGSMHPRGRIDLPKVGIFATRQKERTNRLGISRCRILGIEGTVLRVRDLDALDGTPVVDIKPYVRELGPQGELTQPGWVTELFADYFVRPS